MNAILKLQLTTMLIGRCIEGMLWNGILFDDCALKIYLRRPANNSLVWSNKIYLNGALWYASIMKPNTYLILYTCTSLQSVHFRHWNISSGVTPLRENDFITVIHQSCCPSSCEWHKSPGQTVGLHSVTSDSAATAASENRIPFYCWSAKHHQGNNALTWNYLFFLIFEAVS